MALDTMIVPGFGYGNYFGVPTTVGLAQTSTYTISAGLWLVAGGMATGINVQMLDLNVTATYTIMAGATPPGGFIMSDGSSAAIANTTTSVTIRLINIK